ncbi:MAG: amino acid adenylation domain-containing protein [Proteobacteria bacterium]|nr:amino acid adenylation domain-containing protein [Pseudomonadota bacterium]
MFKKFISIVKLVNEAGKDNPNNIALQYENDHLSYSNFLSRAGAVSNYLLGMGLSKGESIAILFDKSMEMVISTFAVLNTGLVYLPIDPRTPQKRLEFILMDSGTRYIMTTRQLQKKYHLNISDCIFIEEIDCNSNTAYQINCNINGCDPAYAVYTSGSTGKPKGVLISHYSLSNLAISQKKIFSIDKNSRILQFASWGFDASVSEWSTALISGATLCILPIRRTNSKLSIDEHIAKYIGKYNIDVLTLPPSIIATIKFPIIPKVIVSAGEPCTSKVINMYAERTKLLNAYGPSECTVCSTVMKCDKKYPPSTIGQTIDNVKVQILDDNLQEVPIGTTGEIYISGAGVGIGYINNPQLTSKNFFLHPFENGERLYKTGDMARYLKDKNIEYLGRIDSQIKLQGCRIELDEITKVIVSYPIVQHAFIFLNFNKELKKNVIVASILLNNNSVHDSFDKVKLKIRKYIRNYLPGYMTPKYFLFLKEFPLTDNGKIDKTILSNMLESNYETNV